MTEFDLLNAKSESCVCSSGQGISAKAHPVQVRKRTNNPPATTRSEIMIAMTTADTETTTVTETEATAIIITPVIKPETINVMITALTGMKETLVIEEIEITTTVTTNVMIAEGIAEMTITDKL